MNFFETLHNKKYVISQEADKYLEDLGYTLELTKSKERYYKRSFPNGYTFIDVSIYCDKISFYKEHTAGYVVASDITYALSEFNRTDIDLFKKDLVDAFELHKEIFMK